MLNTKPSPRLFEIVFIASFIPCVVFCAEKVAVPESIPASLNLPPTIVYNGSADVKETEIRDFWNAGKKSKAEKLIKDWMKADKKSAAPYVLLAEFRFGEKRYSNCLSYGEKALDINPQSADAYFWRGRAFEMTKKPLDAANEYRAALLARKDFPEAEIALNRVLRDVGAPVENSSSGSTLPYSDQKEANHP